MVVVVMIKPNTTRMQKFQTLNEIETDLKHLPDDALRSGTYRLQVLVSF